MEWIAITNVPAIDFSKKFHSIIDKKVSGKSKDEQMAEKKQELEKRLQDVTGQLGSAKKTAKKGKFLLFKIWLLSSFLSFWWLFDNLFRKSGWLHCFYILKESDS